MSTWIYLDNNATTRPLDEVVEAMTPFQQSAYANPSSTHPFGQAARHHIERARGQVARLLGAADNEVVFTGCGTESINLAIRGLLARRPDRRHLVISTVEHTAVERLGELYAREGYTVDRIPVDGEGRLNLDELAARVTPDTALVSVIWANNETGVIFDIDGVARVTAQHGVPLHLDAVQAAGKLPIDLAQLPVHLASISAHKFHGPKGIGALYVRQRTRLRPLILGGHQERDLRGGTENVAAIVGMGAAAEAVTTRQAEQNRNIKALRDRLERGILAALPNARVNGAGAPRLVNTSNIGFPAVEAEGVLMLLGQRSICVSGGSACSSGSLEPSAILRAMGVPGAHAHGSIRFSLSRFTTEAEVDETIAVVPQVVGRLAATLS